jgi:DNA-binding response OmpR family regulator
MTDTNSASGLRVLLVEDEVMVAMYIEDILGDLGCQVVCAATNLDQALALARARVVDFAVLDINLGGNMSFPVADVLRERKIPFLFVSGYSSAGLLDGYRNEVRLRKPFRVHELANAIERLRPA